MFKQLITIALSALLFINVQAEESPTSISGTTTVNTSQAHDLFKNGSLFVDVRRDSDWDAGRISGALHLELKSKFNQAALSAEAAKDEAIVIYCNGHKCLRSAAASKKAVEWGFSKIFYYRDGFPAWSTAGYPVE